MIMSIRVTTARTFYLNQRTLGGISLGSIASVCEHKQIFSVTHYGASPIYQMQIPKINYSGKREPCNLAISSLQYPKRNSVSLPILLLLKISICISNVDRFVLSCCDNQSLPLRVCVCRRYQIPEADFRSYPKSH
jgi:hypothetical protein